MGESKGAQNPWLVQPAVIRSQFADASRTTLLVMGTPWFSVSVRIPYLHHMEPRHSSEGSFILYSYAKDSFAQKLCDII